MITDLDPLKYNLLFERFLNPERVSMPDFDIDFCQANRDRVIDYVKQKYGADAVSQIVTFGTMAARAAVRDVGRVLDFSYTFCDGISKLIPNKPGQQITIAKARELEPILAEREKNEEEVRQLLELAERLEGLTRNVGMHAGGVLIAPSRLTDFCPLYAQPGSDAAVSQYDKDDVEAIGLVKFDFLGLATLTILEMAKELIQKKSPALATFTFDHIPLDDARVYDLFARGQTEAVFQFESRGMQGMLRDAKPNRLEDLIALNALYRPGPMDLIPSYCARKHGREEPDYPDERVRPILEETYGIMVYQEQVMQMAQILGGYSLGGADMLRRAMGKKKPEEMAEHRSIFRGGAAKNGIPETKADEVFDLMERFAGYGFNKSHSAAYALLAYQTAWLKVHHPAEFYAANMTVEMDDTDKLKLLYEDALKMGLSFEAPDVNRGSYRFEPISDKLVRYGLGAIRGAGQQAIEDIVQAREMAGPFKSLFDFACRIDRTRVNKRTVEALIKAGAFDNIERNRASLLASVGLAFEHADVQEAHAHQGGLFDMEDSPASSTQEPPLVWATPWAIREGLAHEKTAVGFYLSGHLFDEYGQEIRQFVKRTLDDLIDTREPQLLAGIISGLRVINGSRGRVAIFMLDDKTTALECVMQDSAYEQYKELLKEDELLVIQGKLAPDRFSGGMRLTVQQAWDMPKARCRFGKFLRVPVHAGQPPVAAILQLHPPQRIMTEQGDVHLGLTVRLAIQRETALGELDLGEQARFFPDDEALRRWRECAHQGQVAIVYESAAVAS
jgi:DNA polymerase-3 subunit alpha